MKILLVEDDPDLGKLLSEYLKMHEFDVVYAIAITGRSGY